MENIIDGTNDNEDTVSKKSINYNLHFIIILIIVIIIFYLLNK